MCQIYSFKLLLSKKTYIIKIWNKLTLIKLGYMLKDHTSDSLKYSLRYFLSWNPISSFFSILKNFFVITVYAIKRNKIIIANTKISTKIVYQNIAGLTLRNRKTINPVIINRENINNINTPFSFMGKADHKTSFLENFSLNKISFPHKGHLYYMKPSNLEFWMAIQLRDWTNYIYFWRHSEWIYGFSSGTAYHKSRKLMFLIEAPRTFVVAVVNKGDGNNSFCHIWIYRLFLIKLQMT